MRPNGNLSHHIQIYDIFCQRKHIHFVLVIKIYALMMKSENLRCIWSSIISDLHKPSRTFLQRTTRLRMLPTMPRHEVSTVATPEIQNIRLWGNIIVALECCCDDNFLTVYSSSSYSWKHSEEELFIVKEICFQLIILDLGHEYSLFHYSITVCLWSKL